MKEQFQIVLNLLEADFKLRDQLLKQGILSEGYNPEMEKLHIKNAEVLEDLIRTLGFPFEDIAGKEIAEATWVIIQHSISKPNFMKFCLQKMNENLSKSNKIHLAYLTDRICVFENKPQLFGTQYDWNENGELVPNDYDSINLVNQRRLDLGVNTLEEQTKNIQEQCNLTGEKPPKNWTQKQEEYLLWKKKVGWV